MVDTRGATEVDQPPAEAYRCPACNGPLDEHGAAWTCNHCHLTQLLARCRGCDAQGWMTGIGQLPAGWVQLSPRGTLALACSAPCATTVVSDWAAAGLVAPHPASPPTPAAGPPPAAGV